MKYNKSDYIKACQELDLELYEEGKFFCGGCGSRYNLSHSHLIRRSDRPDLACNKKNIVLHCLSINKKGCHDIFESNIFKDMVKMFDFWENMDKIKTLDEEYYTRLVNKFIAQNISEEMIEKLK